MRIDSPEKHPFLGCFVFKTAVFSKGVYTSKGHLKED